MKKPKMPSPLARRGAAERAYLQGQMRAESLRRRKQEQENAERKLMENANDIMMPINKDDLNNENVPSDGQIKTMIENFNAGFAGLGQHPEDLDRNHHHSTFPPKKKNNPLYQMSLASSPPAILKKSFKRSVSAVLADSGIAENGNLLFFPSGVPLLDEEGEIDIDGDSPDSAHGRHGFAGRDGSSADNVKTGSGKLMEAPYSITQKAIKVCDKHNVKTKTFGNELKQESFNLIIIEDNYVIAREFRHRND